MGKLIKHIHGPYTRSSDGRKYISITYEDGSKSTKSWPKYLVECFLGRELGPNETVDHIDRDFTNNSLDNLRIIPLSTHASEDRLRIKDVELKCAWCCKIFYRNPKQHEHSVRQRKAGPFCSKRCVGIYGSSIQNGKIKAYGPSSPANKTYYFPEKDLNNYPPVSELAYESSLDLEFSQFESGREDFFEELVISKLQNNQIRKPANKHSSQRRAIVKSAANNHSRKCIVCHNVFTSRENQTYCSNKCFNKSNEKIAWPPTEVLLKMLEDKGSFVALGKELGVSDNAIRKRIKNHPPCVAQ